MNHLTLRGTHREMGFQWGARLAERGLRLLDHVPFPLEAERRAFAAACHPAYARHFPAALEELEGLAAGQNCRQEDLETVLFTTYALPPACGCSCLAVSNGNGVFFGRNSDFLTALEPDYTHVTYGFSDRAIPFTGNTTSFVQMEDAVNARGLAIGLTSVYTPRPRPGLNAGMVLRLLAETCAAVPEALDRLRVLPLASCQTLTLADAAGDIAVAECSPEGMRVERPGRRALRLRRTLSLGPGGPAAAGTGHLAGGGAVRHDAPGAGAGGGDAGPLRCPGPAGGAKGLSLPV
ncbi:MAG: C45 family autoproteolytic acyltransferase/hydrolase [Dysosmobacter welbionis]